MPHDPPRRGNLPSVTSETNQSRAPHTPLPQAPTSPPPAMPMAPPRGYEAPRPRQRIGRDPPPPARTLTGMPAPPSEPPGDIRDSREIPIDTLLRELAAKAEAERVAKAEVERLEIALADAERTRRAPASSSQAPPSRTDWGKAWFRLVVSLGAVLTALATFLGVRNATTLEPRLDNAEAKQAVQKATATTIEERVRSLEKYSAALAKHSDCVDAERDSAIERGTGHIVEGDHASVEWAEQNQPTAKARTIWKNPPWSIAKDEACPSKPAPPRIVP